MPPIPLGALASRWRGSVMIQSACQRCAPLGAPWERWRPAGVAVLIRVCTGAVPANPVLPLLSHRQTDQQYLPGRTGQRERITVGQLPAVRALSHNPP